MGAYAALGEAGVEEGAGGEEFREARARRIRVKSAITVEESADGTRGR